MKKILIAFTVFFMLLTLVGCGTSTSDGRSRAEILAQNGVPETKLATDTNTNEEKPAEEEQKKEDEIPSDEELITLARRKVPNAVDVKLTNLDGQKIMVIKVYNNSITQKKADLAAQDAIKAVGKYVDEIQMWFTADVIMKDASVQNNIKILSFTLTKTVINSYLDGNIVHPMDYADDLYIAPIID